MADLTETGKFINGQMSAVEILTALPEMQKERILNYINGRNPQMARELSQKCFNFNTLLKLGLEELQQLSRAVKPQVLGIALKGVSIHWQRQVLGQLQRSYAEKCYAALSSSLISDTPTIRRAQAKVVEAAAPLFCSTPSR